MKQVFSLIILGAVATCVGQTSQQPEFVLSGETAFGLIAAEPIVGGIAQNLIWSDNGKYVAVTRIDLGGRTGFENLIVRRGEPLSAEQSLVVYDVEKRKASVVWRSAAVDGQLKQVGWLKGSTMLVGVATKVIRTNEPSHPPVQKSELLLIDGGGGGTRTIGSEEELDFTVQFSPIKSIALVGLPTFVAQVRGAADSNLKGHWETRFGILTADGRLGQPLEIADGNFFVNWSSDGENPIFTQWLRGSDGKYKQEMREFSLSTGASKLLDGQPKTFQPPNDRAIAAGPSSGTLTVLKTTKGVQPAWLTSKDGETQALIAANVSEVVLSPKLTAVAYIAEGAAMVRSIVQIPKELFLQAKNAAERTRIMSNAKQVGLALIMYASDMNDTLPGTQADVNSLVDPYLKNRDISANFVYTFGGGLMGDIKEPANTVLGYITGPGGRAVVYSDGHVKWVADK